MFINSTTTGGFHRKTESELSARHKQQKDLVSIFYRKHKEKAVKYIPTDLQYTSNSPIVKSSAFQMYSITKSPRFKQRKPM